MRKSYRVILVMVLVTGSFWGGGWYSRHEAGKDQGARGAGRVLYYVDPMNPTHTSDKPGLAPCGMPLEPVYAEEEVATPVSPHSGMPASPGTVKITPQKQQIIGVQVGSVEETAETHVVRTLGRIAPDEDRIYRLITTAEGWTGEIRESTTGSLVKKGQVLALTNIYNKDIYYAQQQYLANMKGGRTGGAMSHREQAPTGQWREKPFPGERMAETLQSEEEPHAEHSASEHQHGEHRAEATPPVSSSVAVKPPPVKLSQVDFLVQKAKLDLLDYGFDEAQLEELVQTGEFRTQLEMRSPVTGIVLARNVSPHQRVDRGTEYFRIADLSRVWVVADIFQAEAGYVRPGMRAKLSLPQQGGSFEATVSEVPPQFDAATRTLRVRLETANPGLVLRPEMFVDVEFRITLPPAIAVPADAVLDSGLRKTVFVDLGNGLFEPREVETGWRFGERVEIVQGLKRGERIVVSGNFLIDSESRMKLAAAGFYGRPQKDPVCGMDVYPNKVKVTGLTVENNGKTHFFCSEECKAQFEKDHRHQRETIAAIPKQQADPSAAKPEMPKKPKALVKDPVCGMMISETKAKLKALTNEHQGQVFFFCSRECQEQFSGAPDHYFALTYGEQQADAAGHEGHRHD